MINIRTKYPIARKEHNCACCNCSIGIGEKYIRQTNIMDGKLYDWTCHTDCMDVAMDLEMFNFCDEGLTDEEFREYINTYLYDYYGDEDVPDEINNLSDIEKVRLIKEFLNKE